MAKRKSQGGRGGKARSPGKSVERAIARERLDLAGHVARERLMERLEAERGALVGLLDGMARQFADVADASERALVTRYALDRGERALHHASSRLRAQSVDALWTAARKTVKQRPLYLIAGVVGAGALAARMLRAQAEGATAGS